MAYQISLIERTERQALIEKLLASSKETEEFYDFRAGKTLLQIIRIPVGLPVYRMENFRTFSDQAEYLAREKKPSEFFASGQENESVQQVQHEILFKLAQKGTTSVVPILGVLQREGQRGSLLITHGGTVVNGNRRLAAMRELVGAFPEQFSHINCIVLPKDATPSDILEIEGKLQAIPETRLDYDWIGDAKLVEGMLKLKKTPELVASFLNRKVSEVKNTLQALAEADLYLKEWVKAEGKYGLVSDNGEQLFKDLAGELQGKSAPLQEGARAIAWTLFEKRAKLDGRLYNYNITFGKRAADVLDRLAEELGISLSSEESTTAQGFDFSVDADEAQVDYQPLIAALKQGDHRDETADSLIDICGSILESEKERKSGNAALKTITAANAKLCEVDLSRAAPENYTAIGNQLDAVIQRATSLKEQLNKFPKPGK